MKPEIQKLMWRSRRGMLELDTLFRDYLIQHGEQMDEQEVSAFTSMLELQDQTLLEAFHGNSALSDEGHQRLLQTIISLRKP